MSQLLLTRRSGKTASYYLGSGVWLSLGFCVLMILSLVFYLGLQFGGGDDKAEPDAMLLQMQKEVAEYKRALESVEIEVDKNMNALAQRLAVNQAQVIRLNALGERLIEKAKLDKGEFDFNSEPSLGGPEADGENVAAIDFSSAIVTLEEKLEKSAFQLDILEGMLMSHDLQGEIYPEGRPIKRGWISSYFGYRSDPFTGRKTHHDGIDLAGKDGSEIVAVAAGIVTWAGRRSGYGELIEINHGNGYVTRYGHNKTIKVKSGETVVKGQTISLMGSTGRSTGPHVHFEVHRNGKVVDPMKYVKR